jgi:hypothetical protein
MRAAEKELGFWPDSGFPGNLGLSRADLLQERHSNAQIMWLIFHNLLKTQEKSRVEFADSVLILM